MGWNQKLLFSVHIYTHVNKSGRDRSSTHELSPTEIQLKLAGLGFILEKNQPQVVTAESQACTFHKMYAYTQCFTI